MRVSTAGQARDGFGLDVQEDRIRAWARAEGHRIVHVARDEGISGAAPVADRTGLVEALLWLSTERADGIAVASLDRLSRDLVVQEQLYSEVTGMGCALRSALAAEDHALVHDEDDPSRALVRRIFASIHAYERDMIRLRMRTGKARKAQIAGAYIGGRPPYGWDARGRELVPNAAEQEVRRRVRTWRGRGWSFERIAGALNAESIPSKAGKRWSRSTVRDVIMNDKKAKCPDPFPAERKAG